MSASALGLVMGVTLSACGGRPTAAECVQVYDHLLELTVKDLEGMQSTSIEAGRAKAEEGREAFLEECRTKLSRETMTCVLAADALDDVTACSARARIDAKTGERTDEDDGT